MKIKRFFIYTVIIICIIFYLYSCENKSLNAEHKSEKSTETLVTEALPEPSKVYRENTILAGTESAGTSFKSESDIFDYNAKHGLKQFLLSTELNPNLPFNISCYISNNTVSALIPAGINLSSVIIEFKQSGKYIKVNDNILISGESVLDLSEPVTIIIASKSGTEFPVTLNIETLNTGIPSIALTTDEYKKINSKTETIPCTLYIGGGDNSVCPYAVNEYKFTNGNVKGRGNTSWGFPKKSYTLKLDNKESLLDLPASKNWTLISNYQDKTLLRNDFASKLSDILGLNANMQTRSVDFWLNGIYWGTYLLTEKIEIEENRIDITEFDETLSPEKVGYLFEWDGHVQEISDQQKRKWQTIENVLYDPAQDVYFINTTGWLVIHKPSPSDITPEHLKYLYNYFTKLELAIDNGDYKTVNKYMDLESFVQWYLVEDIMKNMDAGFWSSCYMYLDSGGVLHMGPVWDFDMSLGNCNYGNCDIPNGDYISGTWYYRHLFRMPEFRTLAKKILNEKYDDILSMKEYVTKATKMLEKSIKHNFAVWDILGHSVGANPTDVIKAKTYTAQIHVLLAFFERRLDFVSHYINNLD
ncbi:MAG: CotH kinase family protein [Eubacteriales bacterium]